MSIIKIIEFKVHEALKAFTVMKRDQGRLDVMSLWFGPWKKHELRLSASGCKLELPLRGLQIDPFEGWALGTL